MLLTSTTIHNKELFNALDRVIPMIAYDKYLSSHRFINSSKSYMDARCSFVSLLKIKKHHPDRYVAGKDANKHALILGDLREELEELAKSAFIRSGLIKDNQITMSGTGYYPKNGYMGWHTNRCTPGIRVYFNWADQDARSGLYYYYQGYNNTRQTIWDSVGWNVRMFSTDHKFPFWHAVFSNCNRISIGFRIIPKV